MKKSFLLLLLPFMAFISASTIPYGVNKRPMPVGDDFSKILPQTIGDYKISGFVPPNPDMDGQAFYKTKDSEMFLLFGKCSDKNALDEVFNVVVTESTNRDSIHPDVLVQKKDPSYIKITTTKKPFFGWTRGTYYFSVESHSGAAKLDEFMKLFPY